MKPTTRPDVILVPGSRFLARRIALDPASDVAAQVELALEALSPFPLAQLYHGHVVDPSGKAALVYCAYRRSFTSAETVAWAGASAVLPDFAASLLPATKPSVGLLVRESSAGVEVAAWDGTTHLPAVVLSRADQSALAEALRRAGIPADTPARRTGAAPELVRDKRGVTVRLPESESLLTPSALRSADVRDRGVVAMHERQLRRDRLTWGVFAATLAGIAACLALDLGLLAANRALAVRRAEQAAQDPAVARIQAAHALAARLQQVSSERLMPFEMLALLNDRRPQTVEFTRVATAGTWRLEIDGQTVNVGDLQEFRSQLLGLAALQDVAVRDQRTRDGLTTFRMEIAFRPGWATGGGT